MLWDQHLFRIAFVRKARFHVVYLRILKENIVYDLPEAEQPSLRNQRDIRNERSKAHRSAANWAWRRR